MHRDRAVPRGLDAGARRRHQQELVRRRMEAVRKAERRGDVSTTLKLARDEMLSSVPVVHRMMLHWAWSIRLQELISQAGLTMKAGKLVLISACVGPGNLGGRRLILSRSSRLPSSSAVARPPRLSA